HAETAAQGGAAGHLQARPREAWRRDQSRPARRVASSMSDKIAITGGASAAASIPARVAAVRHASAGGYEIALVNEFGITPERLEALSRGSASTLFPRPAWPSAWYATVAAPEGGAPLLVEVFDRGSGAHVMTL